MLDTRYNVEAAYEKLRFMKVGTLRPFFERVISNILQRCPLIIIWSEHLRLIGPSGYSSILYI
jgi:hypothetical protein